jgi:hypothetical protein
MFGAGKSKSRLRDGLAGVIQQRLLFVT